MEKKEIKRVLTHDHLNTYYLREFRKQAKNMYQVWKRESGFFLAIDVATFGGNSGDYAKETKPFGNNQSGAIAECIRLRREYIVDCAKRRKSFRKVY